MEASKSGIVMIKTKNLLMHPENPRKKIGDITELTESVKKNGIMQNLTVTPAAINWLTRESADKVSTESDFYVIIGNRRLAAAREAGIEELPCVIITQIGLNEQLGIMLEENMQRSDLTVLEQAQGFQMMLDLGETVETITEKTGFSKTTVYHRLNIAKLDPEVLEKKQTGPFQLTLADYAELEKIKDIENRNDVLKQAKNSEDLRYRAGCMVKHEKREANKKKLMDYFYEKGIREDIKAQAWIDGYEKVCEFDLNSDINPKITVGTKDTFVWKEGYQTIFVYKVVEKDSEEEEEGEEEGTQSNESDWARKSRERAEAKEKVGQITKAVNRNIYSCIKRILTGELEPNGYKTVEETEKYGVELAWDVFKECCIIPDEDNFRMVLEDMGLIEEPEDEEDDDEITRRLNETLEKMPVYKQMLILIANEFEQKDLIESWSGKYRKDFGKQYELVQEMLWDLVGFDWDDTEQKEVVNGTSPYYVSE